MQRGALGEPVALCRRAPRALARSLSRGGTVEQEGDSAPMWFSQPGFLQPESMMQRGAPGALGWICRGCAGDAAA